MARPSSLRFRTMHDAYQEFLGAPATGGYGTNEGVILSVMGSTKEKDCPAFDSVREKFGKKKACTFEEAFRACFRGHKDWRKFDFEPLQEAHAEFRHLQLPERVYDALEREAIAGHYEDDPTPAIDQSVFEPAEELPPLELAQRSGPARRSRAGKSTVAALARKYAAAKRLYHATGEQLHMAKVSGLLV